MSELEGFEPQTRARSNTWPLPRPENYVDIDIKEENGKCAPHIDSGRYNSIEVGRVRKRKFMREEL